MSQIIETKKCWRCHKLRLLTKFYLNYQRLRNERLNICEDCINEESKATGESIRELRGIYVEMQLNYRDKIDESNYKRFWLKAIS